MSDTIDPSLHISTHPYSRADGLGHRGSFLLSRLANYFPERFTKFAWLDVGYVAPSTEEFFVDAINEVSQQLLGYPIFRYWHFFNDADAGELMDKNVGQPNGSDLHTNLSLEARYCEFYNVP